MFSGKQISVLSRTSLFPSLVFLSLTLQAQTAPVTPDAATMQFLQSGAAAMHQGKPADAEGFFRQAIAAAPELPDAYLGLGMSQLREGKAEDAAGSLAKAVKLNPNLKGAHMFLGIAQYQAHQLGAATAAFGAGLSRTVLSTYLPAFFAAGALCLLAAGLALMLGRPGGGAVAATGNTQAGS